MKTGCPIIGINDGGGARIQEGVVALGLFAEIFFRNVRASGVIPQISLIMGPCRRRRRLLPRAHRLHPHGRGHQPHVHHRAGRDQDRDRRGRDVRGARRGARARHQVRRRALPGGKRAGLHRLRPRPAVLPAVQQPGRASAGHRVSRTRASPRRTRSSTRSSPTRRTSRTTCTRSSRRCWTRASSLRSTRRSRRTSSSASAASPGAPVGVVANQPMHFAGTLDIDASEKAARFVRTCDAFSIPILTLVDVPGFLPGVTPGVGRHHPPRRQADLRLRRGDRPEGHGDHPEGIRRRLRRHGLQAPRRRHQPGLADRADRGDGRAGRGQHPVPARARRRRRPRALRAQKTTEYEDTLANPYIAAERGYLDAVIRPAETRVAVTRALRSLRTKRETLPPKKHGNIPL